MSCMSSSAAIHLNHFDQTSSTSRFRSHRRPKIQVVPDARLGKILCILPRKRSLIFGRGGKHLIVHYHYRSDKVVFFHLRKRLLKSSDVTSRRSSIGSGYLLSFLLIRTSTRTRRIGLTARPLYWAARQRSRVLMLTCIRELSRQPYASLR